MNLSFNSRTKRSLLATFSLAASLCAAPAGAQERTTIDALGTKDKRENITIQGNNGFTMRTTATVQLEDDVKRTIAAQKEQGFKKAEEATHLATVRNPLEASFDVKKGYVYRAIIVHGSSANTIIGRLRDASGGEISPDVSHAASNPGGFDTRPSNPVIQLADYTPAANGTAVLGIGMMSGQRNDPSAVHILVFKKKA